MTLAKVWAEFLGAQNPIWPPAAILKMTFSTIWPIVICDLWLTGYFGPKNWFVMSVSSFDLVLTFKSNMASGSHLDNCIFNIFVRSAVWLMLCGVFGGKDVIFDASLLIRLGLGLQKQDDHHVANGLCNFGPTGLPVFMVWGYFGSGNCDLLPQKLSSGPLFWPSN